MRRWAEAFVVVNFNLDVGPEVERCVPERRWGIGVGENIAFSSFPDTTLFNEGHLSWSFKLNDPLPNPSASSSSSSSSTALGEEELDPNGGEGGGQQEGRLFGFVLFLQKRDGKIKRGYFQKSLVLLTPLPYPSLFTNIVSFLAPKFFAEGPRVLEAACREIASWPAPTPGATLSLPLLGTTFNVQLPSPNQSSQLVRTSLAPSSASSSTISLILASLPRTPPLKLLGSILPSLWLIWECLILAEPLLCIAPDPRTCSELVWWLRDFIRPLPPGGDIRPYFHIHDASFPLLVNSHQPPPGTVLGVTNPFFRQACGHWSNVISIGDRASSTSVGAGKNDHPDGFKSKRKRHVDKDPELLKRLEAVVASGGAGDFSANNDLRFHFADLTEKFLVPLNRYFASLIPTDLTPTPINTLPPLKPFSPSAFLASLKAHGHPLTFRSKVSGGGGSQVFYESFLKSRNFGGWLTRRCGEANEECEKRARREGWVGGS
ncbi:hypothetical protein BDY24DRAFT_341111 [Mrakia frigida]|uniref:uncharacterized protein n=1 Tax=Mrakia frigida TaxID=29902 RepID=UPI003FCC0BD7